VEQQTQRPLIQIVAKMPQWNLSAEKGWSELMKPSAEVNDGRSQSHIPVILHSICFTSVFFLAFRVCWSVSTGSDDRKMKDERMIKKFRQNLVTIGGSLWKRHILSAETLHQVM
jgi:hypothetical protein